MSGSPEGPKGKRSWPSLGAFFLGRAESAVLIIIGAVLVALAVLMLGNAVVEVVNAVKANEIHERAIEILDRVLLVMMTMEIVYTVAISLEAHALVAEPFLIIGAIAAIRRMLVITATSTKDEHEHTDVFRNTLIELALLALIVITMAVAIYILRKAAAIRDAKKVDLEAGHGKPESHEKLEEKPATKPEGEHGD